MRSLFSIAGLLVIISCGPGQNSKVKGALSSEDKILFEKYLIQGKDLYKSKCQNCHMGNGKGLRTLIPPLMAADYLQQNQQEVACLIKYGAKQKLTVNGVNITPPCRHTLT